MPLNKDIGVVDYVSRTSLYKRVAEISPILRIAFPAGFLLASFIPAFKEFAITTMLNWISYIIGGSSFVMWVLYEIILAFAWASYCGVEALLFALECLANLNDLIANYFRIEETWSLVDGGVEIVYGVIVLCGCATAIRYVLGMRWTTIGELPKSARQILENTVFKAVQTIDHYTGFQRTDGEDSPELDEEAAEASDTLNEVEVNPEDSDAEMDVIHEYDSSLDGDTEGTLIGKDEAEMDPMAKGTDPTATESSFHVVHSEHRDSIADGIKEESQEYVEKDGEEHVGGDSIEGKEEDIEDNNTEGLESTHAGSISGTDTTEEIPADQMEDEGQWEDEPEENNEPNKKKKEKKSRKHGVEEKAKEQSELSGEDQ